MNYFWLGFMLGLVGSTRGQFIEGIAIFDGTNASVWPNFDVRDHVPGEPLSPIDYQNAELLINIPPPNTLFNKDPIELAGLFEGDIILTEKEQEHVMKMNEAKSNDVEESNKRNAIIKERQKWPGGIIPYFISAQFDPVERSTIARAFLEYHRQTCIIFKPRTTERDYIHITKGRGCSSHVGKTGGAQPVILGAGCIYPGIAMHELMHAVGFWHEHSRWDRDDFITILYQNIQPNMEFNFQKYNWNVIQNLGVSYDTSSILHYGPTSFARDKRYPTVVPKIPNSNMGQRKQFSLNDVAKINRLYNCRGGQASERPKPTTTPKPSQSSRCVDSHKYCQDWSARGECQKSTAWMFTNCKKSCNQCNAPCADLNTLCSIWSRDGECSHNPDYMNLYCPKSCGTCQRDSILQNDNLACHDQHVHCEEWAKRGECKLNPNYMLMKCRKSCKVCSDPTGTINKNPDSANADEKFQAFRLETGTLKLRNSKTGEL